MECDFPKSAAAVDISEVMAPSVAPITACVRLSSDLAVLGFDHPRLLFQRVDDLVQEVTGAWVDGVDRIVDPTDGTDRGVDPVGDQVHCLGGVLLVGREGRHQCSQQTQSVITAQFRQADVVVFVGAMVAAADSVIEQKSTTKGLR